MSSDGRSSYYAGPAHRSTPDTRHKLTISLTQTTPSHSSNPSRYLLQSSIPVTKRNSCARLQSCRDVRLGLDERWSIQEGSLVLCIHPSYTLPDHDNPLTDEHELITGEVFVVCRLYADLWALCASASSIASEAEPSEIDKHPMRLAFLPLCAVTLAANFSAFNRRCAEHDLREASGLRYPGNGLPVMPPPRSYSLVDSRQLARSEKLQIRLPEVVYDVLNKVLPECADADYVLLDLPLGALLSNLKVRRSRQSQCLGSPAAETQVQPPEPDKKPSSRRFRRLIGWA
ncbi:uncharacterized protein BO97DRAFT_445761 [Aspergillus homomorphus CBS 101889]|uniref:Uncharacterized protein n=1 Tax=Aspergillus homomorphus (strain CBS 101889) TaxID=1450537 RepID=A0A395HN64_ASPHC|nr:hypothetical protein BO97DRAFT_445761 [Aspergillus homomorphus CBS 101889]RAL08929.1 hypothetical protein BO97DRAFT_445761 [Aspergillus homomorphus CBS 101889]